MLIVLAILFATVQADCEEPKGCPNFLLPVSISGKCLLLLYTPQQTLKSQEWVTECSVPSWSLKVPVAIFDQEPAEPRHGTFNYYKACNVIAVFTEGINTLPPNALQIRRPMLTNDLIIIIDHLDVSQDGFSEESHLKSAITIIMDSLIYTKKLTVPENLLFQLNLPPDKGQNVSGPCSAFHSLTMHCPRPFYCFRKLPTRTSWHPSVTRLHGLTVFVMISHYAVLQRTQWDEVGTASLRDILLHRGISIDRIHSAEAKQISEMASKLNFTPVEISPGNYYKYSHNSYPRIPVLMLDFTLTTVFTAMEFSLRGSLFQTFLYCKDRKLADTNLLAVFNPFDLKLWLYLATSFATVCCLQVFASKISPWNAVMLILAPLVSQNVRRQGKRKAKELILLWNFSAILVSALYVGSIGSLLVVPVKHDRLKSFEDLVKNDYHIQMRGNYSSTYYIMSNPEGEDSLIRNNKHLISLAKSAELAPEDHQQYLKYLAKTRQTAAMNRVEAINNYLRYLRKYYGRSECLKGEELMFVAPVGNKFIPPYGELLRKTSDQFFEAGISQLYEGITERRRMEHDHSRLVPISKNGSTEGQDHSLDFSLDDPQGKITFYLALIGFAVGVIVACAEIAWNPVKCASQSVYECIKGRSSKACGAMRLFISHSCTLLRFNANNQEGEVIMVQAGCWQN